MKDSKQFKSLKTSLNIYKFYAWLIFLFFVGIAMILLVISNMHIELYNIEYAGYVFHINILNIPIVAFIAATLLFFLGAPYSSGFTLRRK